MGQLIVLILLIMFVAWLWQKILITIKPKDAQWHLDEALRLDPNILKRQCYTQTSKFDDLWQHATTTNIKLEDLSKAELAAIIRKMTS